jgi:putative addiction module component (TIGR02574 family)
MPYNKDELLKLSVEERIKLAEELWDSVDDSLIPVTDDEITVAKERYEAYLKKPEDGMNWEEFREKIKSKYGF